MRKIISSGVMHQIMQNMHSEHDFIFTTVYENFDDSIINQKLLFNIRKIENLYRSGDDRKRL